MTTGWDGFASRRREIVWVPLCALWDPAVRILRSHFNGMGREAGTPFINGDHMGINKNRDGMGWDETNVSRGGETPLGLLSLAMLGWEAGGTRAEIYRLCGSKWVRKSPWDGNGTGWAAQISLWDCRPIPSHSISRPTCPSHSIP